ncbi:MAG: CPBP family intramembrane metalloprotease, partial [Bacilli bacterium]|nr:CPBP family intramembrane metalloprotease [Bacilli bacterium]
QSVRDIYQNSFLAALFINVFLAPFLEEFVFRLGFNNIKNKYLYLFLSSFVFALFHAFGSFYNLISLVYILPYFALGLTFGIVYYRSSNVFDSIVIHALHNAVILFLYFIL